MKITLMDAVEVIGILTVGYALVFVMALCG
jgi:hypothetical protein